jgi:hypothetical protein
MDAGKKIDAYIAGQPAPKADQLRALHRLMLEIAPGSRLWFLDGKDETGKTVSNPNIGYGAQDIRYANGTSREFYRVGLSANTTGISIYIMGLDDRKYLAQTYGPTLGKASVTGYCVKFRSLEDLDAGALEDMLRFGLSDRAATA